jgi:hypothetical protein
MVLESPMIADPGSGGSLFDYQSAAQWFPFRISKTSVIIWKQYNGLSLGRI